jgi:anti-sigma B factor antagonist
MTVQTAMRVQQRAGPLPAVTAAALVPPAPRPDQKDIEVKSALRLRLSYPSHDVVVLTARGEIDTVTAPRVAALLWPRLLTELSTVVLDLSEVTFLGVAGLELIGAAHAYAPHRNLGLIVLGGPVAVERALHAGGLDGFTRSARKTNAVCSTTER